MKRSIRLALAKEAGELTLELTGSMTLSAAATITAWAALTGWDWIHPGE
jgi:hypothetical protein